MNILPYILLLYQTLSTSTFSHLREKSVISGEGDFDRFDDFVNDDQYFLEESGQAPVSHDGPDIIDRNYLHYSALLNYRRNDENDLIRITPSSLSECSFYQLLTHRVSGESLLREMDPVGYYSNLYHQFGGTILTILNSEYVRETQKVIPEPGPEIFMKTKPIYGVSLRDLEEKQNLNRFEYKILKDQIPNYANFINIHSLSGQTTLTFQEETPETFSKDLENLPGIVYRFFDSWIIRHQAKYLAPLESLRQTELTFPQFLRILSETMKIAHLDDIPKEYEYELFKAFNRAEEFDDLKREMSNFLIEVDLWSNLNRDWLTASLLSTEFLSPKLLNEDKRIKNIEKQGQIEEENEALLGRESRSSFHSEKPHSFNREALKSLEQSTGDIEINLQKYSGTIDNLASIFLRNEILLREKNIHKYSPCVDHLKLHRFTDDFRILKMSRGITLFKRDNDVGPYRFGSNFKNQYRLKHNLEISNQFDTPRSVKDAIFKEFLKRPDRGGFELGLPRCISPKINYNFDNFLKKLKQENHVDIFSHLFPKKFDFIDAYTFNAQIGLEKFLKTELDQARERKISVQDKEKLLLTHEDIRRTEKPKTRGTYSGMSLIRLMGEAGSLLLRSHMRSIFTRGSLYRYRIDVTDYFGAEYGRQSNDEIPSTLHLRPSSHLQFDMSTEQIQEPSTNPFLEFCLLNIKEKSKLVPREKYFSHHKPGLSVFIYQFICSNLKRNLNSHIFQFSTKNIIEEAKESGVTIHPGQERIIGNIIMEGGEYIDEYDGGPNEYVPGKEIPKEYLKNTDKLKKIFVFKPFDTIVTVYENLHQSPFGQKLKIGENQLKFLNKYARFNAEHYDGILDPLADPSLSTRGFLKTIIMTYAIFSVSVELNIMTPGVITSASRSSIKGLLAVNLLKLINQFMICFLSNRQTIKNFMDLQCGTYLGVATNESPYIKMKREEVDGRNYEDYPTYSLYGYPIIKQNKPNPEKYDKYEHIFAMKEIISEIKKSPMILEWFLDVKKTRFIDSWKSSAQSAVILSIVRSIVYPYEEDRIVSLPYIFDSRDDLNIGRPNRPCGQPPAMTPIDSAIIFRTFAFVTPLSYTLSTFLSWSYARIAPIQTEGLLQRIVDKTRYFDVNDISSADLFAYRNFDATEGEVQNDIKRIVHEFPKRYGISAQFELFNRLLDGISQTGARSGVFIYTSSELSLRKIQLFLSDNEDVARHTLKSIKKQSTYDSGIFEFTKNADKIDMKSLISINLFSPVEMMEFQREKLPNSNLVSSSDIMIRNWDISNLANLDSFELLHYSIDFFDFTIPFSFEYIDEFSVEYSKINRVLQDDRISPELFNFQVPGKSYLPRIFNTIEANLILHSPDSFLSTLQSTCEAIINRQTGKIGYSTKSIENFKYSTMNINRYKPKSPFFEKYGKLYPYQIPLLPRSTHSFAIHEEDDFYDEKFTVDILKFNLDLLNIWYMPIKERIEKDEDVKKELSKYPKKVKKSEQMEILQHFGDYLRFSGAKDYWQTRSEKTLEILSNRPEAEMVADYKSLYTKYPQLSITILRGSENLNFGNIAETSTDDQMELFKRNNFKFYHGAKEISLSTIAHVDDGEDVLSFSTMGSGLPSLSEAVTDFVIPPDA